MFNFKFRKLSIIFHFILFIASIFAIFFLDKLNITIFNINFDLSQINLYLLVLINFAFFIFNFVSKNSLKGIQKKFYSFSILNSIFVNMAILCDKILFIFCLLFFIFLADYLFNKSKEQFLLNCMVLFSAFALISYGALRYFVINDISFDFSNLLSYQNKIDNTALLLSFYGFSVVIAKLFSFLPFRVKQNNHMILGTFLISYYSIASSFVIKIFPIFSYLIYKHQTIITLYLMLNIIYFAFYQFKSKSISEFLASTMPINAIISLLGLFIYSESGFVSFIYYSVCMILSYLAGFILCDLIVKNMGSDNFYHFKKIPHADYIAKIFIFVIMLNLAKAPILAGFSSFIYCFINIFFIENSDILTSLIPYILFVCAFLISLNTLKILAKILSNPLKTLKHFKITQNQFIAFCASSVLIIIVGAGMRYIINQLMNITGTGIF